MNELERMSERDTSPLALELGQINRSLHALDGMHKDGKRVIFVQSRIEQIAQ